MWRQVLIFSIILGLLGFFGCKDVLDTHNLLTNHNIDMKGTMHGKKVYKGVKNCTACHGINLDGNGYVAGCYSCHDALWQNDDHTVDRNGSMHLNGAVQAKTNCVGCHSADLKGSLSRPSCYKCHDDNWTALSMHTLNKGNSLHGTGLFTPANDCSSCHGTDFKGSGNAPSCNQCHGNLWDKVDHTDFEDGVGHKRDKNNPTVDCISCHGADLRGGDVASSSCYKCHGAKWLEEDDSVR